MGRIAKQFGFVIKSMRSRAGISQEELAERAGLHRTYISDVERGARNLSLDTIDRLASGLHISISTLFSKAANRIRPGSVHSEEEFVEIILIEHDPKEVELTLQAFARSFLSNQIRVLTESEAALDYFFGRARHRRLAGARPRVILLDLEFPKQSGLDLLRQLKAEEKTKDIPVVVLTGSERDAQLPECRRLGVQHCLIKPVDFASFSRIIPRLGLHWALLKSEAGADAIMASLAANRGFARKSAWTLPSTRARLNGR